MILASPAEPVETVQSVSMFSKPILACTLGLTSAEDLEGFPLAPPCGSDVDGRDSWPRKLRFCCAISPTKPLPSIDYHKAAESVLGSSPAGSKRTNLELPEMPGMSGR